ncbi:hypothetical protein [Campylobacter showae]|uniref:hypothetical protein n=1 Tax=Campylobacter showae TaxID=204 RepID=UPI000F08E834|nr:hypothetical protein [Campylobacter showae]
MNFLIANKLWLIVIGALAGVMLGLGIEIWKLRDDIKDAKAGLETAQKELAIKEANLQISAANLSECNTRIDFQNEKIKALTVKPPDVVATQERVVTKFKKIEVPVKDAQCEKKLKFYEELINEAGK